jgi:hypothetical protein
LGAEPPRATACSDLWCEDDSAGASGPTAAGRGSGARPCSRAQRTPEIVCFVAFSSPFSAERSIRAASSATVGSQPGGRAGGSRMLLTSGSCCILPKRPIIAVCRSRLSALLSYPTASERSIRSPRDLRLAACSGGGSRLSGCSPFMKQFVCGHVAVFWILRPPLIATSPLVCLMDCPR